MRGIFKEIAAKEGKTITEVKHEFMKVVTEAAKKYLGLKPGEKPRAKWFEALHVVLPIAYDILRKEKKIPTVEEILSRVGVKA